MWELQVLDNIGFNMWESQVLDNIGFKCGNHNLVLDNIGFEMWEFTSSR